MRGAVAGRAVVELARILAHEVEKRLQVGDRHALRIDDDHLRHAGDQADRNEVGLQVVVELGVHRRRDRVVHRAHEEGVAVGRGLARDRRAHRATGAAAVVDDHLLAETARQHGGERARERIGAAAAGEGHDEGHRPGGPAALRVDPGVRECGARGGALQPLAARPRTGQGSMAHGVSIIVIVELTASRPMRATAQPRRA